MKTKLSVFILSLLLCCSVRSGIIVSTGEEYTFNIHEPESELPPPSVLLQSSKIYFKVELLKFSYDMEIRMEGSGNYIYEQYIPLDQKIPDLPSVALAISNI